MNLEWKCIDTLNDRFVIEKLFPGKRDGFFIDVGAALGTVESATYWLEKEFGWKGFLIEPCQTFIDRLRKNRTSTVINKAVYSYDGVLPFIDSPCPYYSTLRESIIENHRPKIFEKGFKEYDVECMTLKRICDEFGAPNHMNLIAIDAEGSDNHILRGFDFAKYTVDCFIVELTHGESKTILEKNGFVEIYNEFNTKCSWEHYFVRKDFPLDKSISFHPLTAQ